MTLNALPNSGVNEVKQPKNIHSNYIEDAYAHDSYLRSGVNEVKHPMNKQMPTLLPYQNPPANMDTKYGELNMKLNGRPAWAYPPKPIARSDVKMSNKNMVPQKIYENGNHIKTIVQVADAVPNERDTELIVTMGPEAGDRNKVSGMLNAGMDIARFELTPDNKEEVANGILNLKDVLAVN